MHEIPANLRVDLRVILNDISTGISTDMLEIFGVIMHCQLPWKPEVWADLRVDSEANSCNIYSDSEL